MSYVEGFFLAADGIELISSLGNHYMTTHHENLTSLVTALDNEITTVLENWHGPDANRIQALWSEHKAQFNQNLEQFMETGNYLVQHALDLSRVAQTVAGDF